MKLATRKIKTKMNFLCDYIFILLKFELLLVTGQNKDQNKKGKRRKSALRQSLRAAAVFILFC